MQIQVLKSKIHNAFVTEANIEYIGSITIDEDLMDAVDLIEGEQVHVINHRNGERLITYVIRGKRGTGEICMNGPAALKISTGDKVIIIAYASMSQVRAKQYKPKIIFPGTCNSLQNEKRD
ncbi:MAG: aspartate 1-decarboxylase [Bacteroidetes bacterium]|jgi:aspartate 1-decarboxylase|nr:aspartate 1-decarboxylase [Bacteroidota bacterium]